MEPGLELFLFQEEGIRFAPEREGALIADEMGLRVGCVPAPEGDCAGAQGGEAGNGRTRVRARVDPRADNERHPGPTRSYRTARLCGGPGRPAGLTRGYFVRPTVFSRVNNAMTIAREEIFGPVLAIIPYRSDQEAIDTANDTDYGLSSYVWSSDPARAQRVAQRIRAGMVHINGAGVDLNAPFGGYKKSGNGREWGVYGLRDFLEIKAIMRAPMPDAPAIGEPQKVRGSSGPCMRPPMAAKVEISAK